MILCACVRSKNLCSYMVQFQLCFLVELRQVWELIMREHADEDADLLESKSAALSVFLFDYLYMICIFFFYVLQS